jgi:MFS transporter, DHA1 family, multidrug resistance protein
VILNRTLYLLWFSDVFILTGFGLIAPIMAIYIAGSVTGGTIFAAGLASALYMVTKAIVQIPFSRYVDSHENKVKWLHLGTFLIVTVPFQYIFAKNVYSIYIAQIIYGIGAGIAASSWLSLWSTHLDKHHEGFEWSLYSATVGLGTGLSAFLGGTLATHFGFKFTMFIMGTLAFIGLLILLYLEHKNYNKNLDYISHPKKKNQYVKKGKLTNDNK